MKFKVGDIVYQTKNTVWSGPMKIEEVDTSSYVSCIHPILGRGAFSKKELILITGIVARKINKLYGGNFDNEN